MKGIRKFFPRRRRYARKSMPTKRVPVGRTRTNLVRLQKQVSSISRSLRRKAENVQYTYGFDQNLSSDYTSMCITNYASWTPIFGTTSDDGTDPKAYHKYTSMDCRLSIGNELDTVDYTVMLVSLRDEGQNVFNVATGALSLVNNRDYTNANLGYSQTRVNPKMFKVHKVKRFTTSNFGASLFVPTAAAAGYKPYVKWTWSIKPRTSIVNPIGNWTALGCNRDPSKNYFIIAFNNNSAIDLEYPSLAVACCHTIQVQGA